MATCVKQKMATSDEDAAYRSAIQVRFPSGLTGFANWNQLNVTRTFQEHLHILGMVDLATVVRIIHHVGDRNIKLAEQWNQRRTPSTVTNDAPYDTLLGWAVLVNIQHSTPLSMSHVNARWIRLNVWNLSFLLRKWCVVLF